MKSPFGKALQRQQLEEKQVSFPSKNVNRTPSKQICALPNIALRSLLRNTPASGILSKILYRWTQRNRNGKTNGVLKLTRIGLDVFEEYFYASALASVPGRSAYVIGEAVLLNARYDAGVIMNDIGPNYAVVGESEAHFCGKPNPLMIRTGLRRDFI